MVHVYIKFQTCPVWPDMLDWTVEVIGWKYGGVV